MTNLVSECPFAALSARSTAIRSGATFAWPKARSRCDPVPHDRPQGAVGKDLSTSPPCYALLLLAVRRIPHRGRLANRRARPGPRTGCIPRRRSLGQALRRGMRRATPVGTDDHPFDAERIGGTPFHRPNRRCDSLFDAMCLTLPFQSAKCYVRVVLTLKRTMGRLAASAAPRAFGKCGRKFVLARRGCCRGAAGQRGPHWAPAVAVEGERGRLVRSTRTTSSAADCHLPSALRCFI